MITIVNYGLGNPSSIYNMLKKIGVKAEISSDPEFLFNSEKFILPGVGAFDEGMENLSISGIKEVLEKKVLLEKVPILGICLGMQLMTNSSEEGVKEGLGWIDATTVRFRFEDKNLKVPHMGWNVVKPSCNNHILSIGYEEIRYYHVHSYYVKLKDPALEMASTHYGFKFTSAFHKDNIWGVQFHPEKSHKFGMELLKNFSNI